MTTKSDFAAANEALLAEERTKIGPPPTAEKMLAFTRGELSVEEADRIREHLIAYPELLRTLTAPFPEGAEPGDPDYLSDEEFARHWATLQKRRLRPEGGRVIQFWRAFGAIAASLAVVFGVMFWRAETELQKPRLLVEEIFLPDGQRGIGTPSNELTAVDDFFFVPFVGETPYEGYRAEIVDLASPQRTVWISKTVPRRPDGTVMLVVSRGSLNPGKYKLVIYGVNGARQERLNTYTIRVPEHQ